MKNILNRKNLFNTQSLGLLLIILAIIVVINLISANHFGRLDLTAEKQYSISKVTKETIKNLDDLLTIKVYFSQKLPPNLLQVSQYVKDILGEYKAYSNKVNVEIIDPTKDEETKQEVLYLGIPELEMQVLEKDEFKVQKGYLGIALFYADNKEIIPVVQDVQNLEYELTTTIKRLTAENLKTIGFLTGHEEHGLYDLSGMSQSQTSGDYTTIKKALDKNYNVTTVDLTATPKIENIDTLIIAGPKKALTEEELGAIDQFITSGGNAIFLLDEINIEDGLQATTNQTGLEQILSSYGIQVNTNLVLDKTNENVGFASGYMQFYLPYPFWPKLIKDNFAKDNPIMAKLQTISLPWPSSLSPLDRPGIETTTLATTTFAGSTMSSPFDLDPNKQYNPTDRKKVPMIILAKGKFTSAYTEQDTSSESVSVNQPGEEGQIIVVADSDFISDSMLQRFPDNAVFFLNAADYLTMGSDLISIRAKTLTNRPLENISEAGKTRVKVINIILIPVLIIIIGVVKFYLRKKK